MITLLWIFAGIVSIAFAYSMRFTQATLSYGRSLADTEVGTGVQDAITPPWQTNLAMMTYICFAAVVGVMWWQIGWGSGLGSLALVLFGGGIVGAMLPDKDSSHFRGLIQRSMISRHADFIRDGDKMRAQAMGDLLTRAGIEPGARREYVDELTTNEWSIERAEKTVNDYGGAMMNKTPGPNGMVADARQLPHPKATIKQAILYLLENGNFDDSQKDSLVTGFFSLADFQPGVDGDETGVDVSSEEFMALPTEEQIRKIADVGIGQEWLEVSSRERDELVSELKKEGHWRE